MKGIEWLHTTKCQHTMHIHDTCYIITQHPESDKRQCIRNQSGLLPNCMGCMLNSDGIQSLRQHAEQWNNICTQLYSLNIGINTKVVGPCQPYAQPWISSFLNCMVTSMEEYNVGCQRRVFGRRCGEEMEVVA